jgi:hypothetical protein
MLRSVRQLIGYEIAAIDGELGKAEDFYFDDQTWMIRYLIARVEKPPFGREVLIAPASMKQPDWSGQAIPVALTVQQVKQSPEVDTDLPVSRQQEAKLAEYYNWVPWWEMPGMPFAGMPLAPVVVRGESKTEIPGDPYLRSVREVATYSTEASDGSVGHVEDFIAQTEDWVIRYIVVNTRRWLPGRSVLLSPAWLRRVDWSRKQVHVDLTCEEIRNSLEFDPSAPVNREYEERLYDYYGRPKYWERGTG